MVKQSKMTNTMAIDGTYLTYYQLITFPWTSTTTDIVLHDTFQCRNRTVGLTNFLDTKVFWCIFFQNNPHLHINV